MLSNLCELAGMVAITTGVWEIAGRSVGLIFAGCIMVVAGLALDGVKVPRPKIKFPKLRRSEKK
jgi:hypothetical protein